VAKKVRTPTPRPRQQGPRRRDSKQPFRPLGLNRTGLLAGVGAGVVVGVIILVIALTGGGGGGGGNASAAADALSAAGCTFNTYPSEGRSHVQSLSAKVTYKTFPPTSGTHYYIPAIWNRYTQPLVLVQEVHNLEHGGIIVQYGPKTPADTKQRLTDFFNESPNGIVVAPLPALGDKIALGAWTAPELSTNAKKQPQGTAYLAKCTTYDASAFEKFRDAFRYKGPERIPADLMQPGQ
jgi:hypothetical protein